jgi:hypothetical protein
MVAPARQPHLGEPRLAERLRHETSQLFDDRRGEGGAFARK